MEWTNYRKIYLEIRKKHQLIYDRILLGYIVDGCVPASYVTESEAAWSEFLESLGIKKTLILWDEDFIFPPDDKMCASDESFVTIFFDKNFNRGEKVHLKIPIEAAEKILILGL